MNLVWVKKSKYAMAALLVASVAIAAPLTGCKGKSKKNPVIENVDGPYVGYVNGQFTLSMVIKNLSYDVGLRLPVPNTQDSFLEVGPDLQSNGTLVMMAMSTADIEHLSKNAVHFLDPMALPGGRPLPGISDGYLPAVAVEVPKLKNVVFYVGSNVFGAFVPVNLPWEDYMGTFRFYDATGTRVGNLSIIGKDENKENSGVLLLVDIKGRVQQLMKLK